MYRLLGVIGSIFKSEEGASVVEYAVALTLVAVVTLAAITLLGSQLSSFFVSASSTI